MESSGNNWWVEKTSGGFGVIKSANMPKKASIVRPEGLRSMETDREIMRDLAVQYCDGEGDYLLCSADQCHVGQDDD